MTSGMLHLIRHRADDTTTMEFSKNRVGDVNQELSYSIGRDFISYSPVDSIALPDEDEDGEEVEETEVYAIN